jgi:thymidine kinase
MFSSKTSQMLAQLERFKHQKKQVVLFKPDDDLVKYSISKVVTHGGWAYDAISVSTGADVIEYIISLENQPDVVAIDEAFMISGIADVCIWLYRNAVNVVVASLDMSSQAKPFKEIEKMLSWATTVTKCTAVCTVCGEDAYYTYKKIKNEDEIELGGKELYEPRCIWCHPMILKDL